MAGPPSDEPPAGAGAATGSAQAPSVPARARGAPWRSGPAAQCRPASRTCGNRVGLGRGTETLAFRSWPRPHSPVQTSPNVSGGVANHTRSSRRKKSGNCQLCECGLKGLRWLLADLWPERCTEGILRPPCRGPPGRDRQAESLYLGAVRSPSALESCPPVHLVCRGGAGPRREGGARSGRPGLLLVRVASRGCVRTASPPGHASARACSTCSAESVAGEGQRCEQPFGGLELQGPGRQEVTGGSLGYSVPVAVIVAFVLGDRGTGMLGGGPGTVSPSEHRPDSSKTGPVSQLDAGGYEDPSAVTATRAARRPRHGRAQGPLTGHTAGERAVEGRLHP
ncbi:uncharacterized protein LOC120603979 [Pteropus medius]|uniref:uncharacterized protein LOC120603979 n=1 Tax=Pteropus vampyrus TaxID=132908 RepID=UPI00196AFCBE|nr:uncharacterized protein LOC120603979 [Pteropus giganteus]